MDAPTVGRIRSVSSLFVLLLLLWIMLNGSLAGDVLIVGIVASAAIALLHRDGLSLFTEARLTPGSLVAAFGFIGYFLKELVKSNLHIAVVVLDPALPVRPGIVRVHTRLRSRMGRLLLANSITLTPGTLTVEIDGEWLWIHWVTMEAADQEEATRQIVAGFESYLEVIYG